MPRATGSRSAVSKDVVSNEPCDPQFEIMGDLKGKVEQFKLFDLDLIDQVLFSQLKIDVF
jgi:hypothetical protein